MQGKCPKSPKWLLWKNQIGCKFHKITVCSLGVVVGASWEEISDMLKKITQGYFWCSAFELLPWRIVQDCFKLLVGSQFQSMKSYSHHRWLFAAVSNLSDVRPIQFAEMLYRAGENWSLGVILNHFHIQVVIYENILMAAYSSSYNCNFSKLTKSLSNTFCACSADFFFLGFGTDFIISTFSVTK